MNMNQIINIVIRQIVRQVVNLGIKKGFSMMPKAGKSDAPTSPEHDQASADAAKRAKQAAKLARRTGRM